ncbi:hypothetical protein [Tenacibaculum haliotis]|uniref:hypothetical protein n=1 Tax=Tenacibaculum haliotis TaxID=1888914 RepID=UPI0021B06D75|nr:hypothetical protein [Tenacibaculum haliotis]MCT4698080.1 hypothetical protein [Tenacibaculum haliotis]
MALKKVSKEVKETLKKEHGDKLKSLILPLDDMNIDEMEVLAIIPKRSVVGQTMKFMQTDPKKGQEILVKNCLVTGKEEVLNDDALFYAAAGLLTDLIPIRQGKFGKV